MQINSGVTGVLSGPVESLATAGQLTGEQLMGNTPADSLSRPGCAESKSESLPVAATEVEPHCLLSWVTPY